MDGVTITHRADCVSVDLEHCNRKGKKLVRGVDMNPDAFACDTALQAALDCLNAATTSWPQHPVTVEQVRADG